MKKIILIVFVTLALVLTGSFICSRLLRIEASTKYEPTNLRSENKLSSNLSAANQNLEEESFIMLNAKRIDTKSARAMQLRGAEQNFTGKRMHLVKFRGPIRPDWYRSIIESGLEIVNYIPNYAYLVYGDASSLQSLQSKTLNEESLLEWDGEYLPEFRLAPELNQAAPNYTTQENQSGKFIIQLFKDDPTNSETLALIKPSEKKLQVIRRWAVLNYVNLVAVLDNETLAQLSTRPDVISISPWVEAEKTDERQDIIMAGNFNGSLPAPGNYLSYLTNRGFNQEQFDASGFIVNINDSGIDSGAFAPPAVAATKHFGLFRLGDPSSTSRVAYARLQSTQNTTNSTTVGCDGHGTIDAHIIAGYVPDGAPFNTFPHSDAEGFRYGLGVAPFVKLGSSVIFDPSFTEPDLLKTEAEAYRDGARISSNSWGIPTRGVYDVNSQMYDAIVRDAQSDTSPVARPGNQEYTVLFAAGNQGVGERMVISLGTAKNVITVGASENVRPLGQSDGCGVSDLGADSANDIIYFSGRGPTSDGRTKPEIVAPGTHITGGVAQENLLNPVTGNGKSLSCFNATGVCGLLGNTDFFFPTGQQWYTVASGTSQATPAVAGFAALIRQHFINQNFNPPSPALTKALILVSARYMTGTGAGDNLFSNSQGMGIVNMNNYFDNLFGQSRIIRDQIPADLLTASGQERVFTGTIADPTKPFRATLAWTDAPGSTTGNAYVNNLDLEVIVGERLYKGNVFIGANSNPGVTIPNSKADEKNNSESVFIPAGASGRFIIRVKAKNIAGDGVPGNAELLDQDFALVAQNALESPQNTFGLDYTDATIVNESIFPANDSPDLGETITVRFGLKNLGNDSADAIKVALLDSEGVIAEEGSQNYGTIAPGATVYRDFRFSVPETSSCGGVISLSFKVESATKEHNLTKTFVLGNLSKAPSIAEGFDGVTAPDLPPGWESTQKGQLKNWKTTTSPFEGVNAVTLSFSDINLGGGLDGEASLTTPPINVNSAYAEFEFRHRYFTQFGRATSDGGVLEIKIGDGDFRDIIEAGGSFISGGYDDVLRVAACGYLPNALRGRMVWGGDSDGFKLTRVKLPQSAFKQTVQLRWRGGSDCSRASGEQYWTIDSVKLFGESFCLAPSSKAPFDFDGDGRSDISIFRPEDSVWYLLKSRSGFAAMKFGISSDLITPADYDGDGQTDIAVFRDGNWYLQRSEQGFTAIQFGIKGDLPQPADIDGDGKAEPGVYRPSNGAWYFLNLHNNQFNSFYFGATGDKPLIGDYDGDGKADYVVYRPADGYWYLQQSRLGFAAFPFGISTDKPVPGDYDGDNKTDAAVYRNGTWYLLQSSLGFQAFQFGLPDDSPAPADYDGDGKTDVAVFRPQQGVWYIMKSSDGAVSATQFGLQNDKPVPAALLF